MQSKTWKGALMTSCSLLAFGVPMTTPGWQLNGTRWLDMWKPGYDLASIGNELMGKAMGGISNAKKL